MKAATPSKPGQVIVMDFPEPQAGKEDLIVETLVCGVCSTDVKLVQKGAREPKYALGHEIVGKIVHVPTGSHWKKGEHVVVAPYLPCDHCYYCMHGQPALCQQLYDIFPLPGGLSERILIPAELGKRGLFPVPPGMSDERASLAEPLGCVLLGFEASHLKPEDSLLVIGDGPMGQLAAAAGKALGSAPVIVAGMTDHRLAYSQQFYADEVVDVTRRDLKTVVDGLTGSRGADVVLVAVSSGEALASGLENVRPGGTVNSFAGVPEGTMIELDVRKVHYQQYYITGSSGTTPKYMTEALALLGSSNVDFSKIITASYTFPEVGEAVSYMERRLGLKSLVFFEPYKEVN